MLHRRLSSGFPVACCPSKRQQNCTSYIMWFACRLISGDLTFVIAESGIQLAIGETSWLCILKNRSGGVHG